MTLQELNKKLNNAQPCKTGQCSQVSKNENPKNLEEDE